MSSSKPSLHYNFAHRILPNLLENLQNQIHEVLSGPSKDAFLLDLWQRMETELGVQEPSDGLHCEELPLSNGQSVFVIHMPPPTQTPQALYVGIVFSISDGTHNTDNYSFQYFTLELGASLFSDEPAWMLGGWDGSKHLNRGRLIDNQVETFRKAIEDVVTGKPISVGRAEEFPPGLIESLMPKQSKRRKHKPGRS